MAHMGEEKCVQCFGGNVGGGDAGGPRPRWWIILKWTLKEQNERTWSGLIRLRMNTNDRML